MSIPWVEGRAHCPRNFGLREYAVPLAWLIKRAGADPGRAIDLRSAAADP